MKNTRIIYTFLRTIAFLTLLIIFTFITNAQENEFDRLLNEEVENINPVYKPVENSMDPCLRRDDAPG